MNRTLNRVGSLLLLLTASESLLALFRSSFSLVFPDSVFLWLGLLCCLLWAAASFRFGFFIGVPLSAAVLWYLYRYYTTDLVSELRDILDHLTAEYYAHYGSNPVVSYSGYSDSHMVAILVVMFLIAAFLSIALTSGSFRIGLSEFATIPFFCFCIAVNGNPPVLPVFGMFLFWGLLQIGGESYRPNDAGGKAALLGLIPCALLLAVTLFFFRPSEYVAEEQDFDLSRRFDRLGQYLSEKLDGEEFLEKIPLPGRSDSQRKADGKVSGWDTGGNRLDLTVSYDFSVFDHEIFRLSSDTSGSLYLRGRSFGDYSGTGWLAAADNTHASALSYVAQSAVRSPGHTQHRFQIQGDRSYDLLYLPYFSLSDRSGDVSVSSDGLTSYGGDYYSFGSSTASLPDSLISEEESYRQYVRKYYTRLPESTAAAMQGICLQNGFRSDSPYIISEVADFVRSNSSYDLGTPAYPSDDYAVYFLTVSRRGYCTHFATAACVLYRSLGIPARVCEGFLVVGEPGHMVSVKGSSAHAWVEVYLDGLGWIPVEVTAGTGETSEVLPGSVPDSAVDQGIPLGSVPSPSPGLLPDISSESAELTGREENMPSGESSSALDGGGSSASSGSPQGADGAESGAPVSETGADRNPDSSGKISPRAASVLRICLRILLSVLLGILLLYLRYRIIRVLSSRRLSASDSRQRAVNLFRSAAKVSHYGGVIPEAVRSAAERAVFSLHEISEDELLQSDAALTRYISEVYLTLSRTKKILFRWWSGLC
ncbi:MAG: transglutaminase-like domain-containing protein [Oscillospiraceae bacterium]|nr:transglutaminase-like domain-containing protein [Oscillospiraceae bacterium]